MNKIFISTLIFISSFQVHGTENTDSGIKHMVFCWLNEAGNSQHITKVINTSKELAAIPTVIDIVVGKPVPNDRAIVDDTFDVGLVMTFRNNVDLNTYLNHEDHTQRVKEILAPLCDQIKVYDVQY